MKQKIQLRSQDHIYLIDPDNIYFCQSDNCYTIINLASKKLLVSQSLTKFSKELPDTQFIRVSQSYLINSNFISLIEKKRKIIKLDNEIDIPFTISIKTLLELLRLKHNYAVEL
ncbi:LytTR family transcriptional regulator [Mucilaginibacter limnophilus]|uniref:LytTR family transcriptional regulator n=1 Tax=Mucilaginibacter limnophilus TaxID=1932778 RepID=A0A3S2XY58_9SPHI|nr:LytTR family transcriptional regulator [Mucilaginibacter limnophilus]